MKKKYRILLFLSLGLVLLTAFLWYGNNHIVTTEYSLSLSGMGGDLNGFRIVQISDFHNARFGNDNERLLGKIQAAKPDILVVTGDYVDHRRTNTDVAIALTKELVKICPVYYVTGNHELLLPDAQLSAFLADLAQAGIRILHDQSEVITRGEACFALVGFWDNSLWGDMPKEILSRVPQNIPNVILAHEPQGIWRFAQADADLVLSGHAHGGQIRLPFVGGLIAPGQGLFPKYTAGLYTEGSTRMVVSRGLGNSLFPFRIFNDPEIVVVTLTD